MLLQCASRFVDFCSWLVRNLVFCPGPLSSLFSHRNLLAASALVAFKCLTSAHKLQQTLGREKAKLLFMEEGAGGRNEKKTAQGVAGQKPFLLSVTRLGALPRVAPILGEMKALISILLGVPSMTIACSLWLKQVPKILRSLFQVPDVAEIYV